MRTKILIIALAAAVLTALPSLSIAAGVTISGNGVVVDFNDAQGAISAAQYNSSEYFALGYYNSDWGLQLGSDTSTFARNGSSGSSPISLSLTTSSAIAASYSGAYTRGGSNIAIIRSYEILGSQPLVKLSLTLTNMGVSDATVRSFESFDPDGAGSSSTTNDRFSLTSPVGPMVVGQAARPDGSTFLLGALDPGAVVAASGLNYAGFITGTELNTIYDAGGADSAGGTADRSIDVARSTLLTPGQTKTIETYLAFGSTPAEAQAALSTVAPPPPPVVAVPETSTWVMGFLALGASVFLARRKKRSVA